MTEAELANYRQLIQKVMRGEHLRPVFNGTLDHACVVTEEAFRAAKVHVKLLTHELLPDCYGRPSVRAAAEQFLTQESARLDVLIEDPEAFESSLDGEFLRMAFATAPGRVRVAQVSASLRNRYGYNFLVVDDAAYRFESDREAHVAAVGGGSKALATAQNLAKIFESIQASARPVATQPAHAAQLAG